MNESIEKNTTKIAKLFNEIASRYDKINSLLSFGLDRKWRRKCEKHLPKEENLHVLDLACGSCAQMIAISKKRPSWTFTGVDLSENLLKIGEEKISKLPIKLKKLIRASALDLPLENESFAAVTISFGIRNMENLEKALGESYRVLEKNGKIYILEFSLPEGRFQKKIILFYLKYILPKIGNLLSNHSHAYTYLNETIVNFPSGEGFIKHMKNAGFKNTKLYPMTFGVVTLYIGQKAEEKE